MILKKVEIKNYCTFKNEVFEFDGECLNVITGQGGAGKSNLIRAIFWCLGIELQTRDKNYIDYVNIEEASVLRDDNDLMVKVSVEFNTLKFGNIRIYRSENLIKKDGKLIHSDCNLVIEKIDNNSGVRCIRREQANIILNSIKKSICLITDAYSRNIVHYLLLFISQKYEVSLYTSRNILKSVVSSANIIFKKICKKKWLDLVFDETGNQTEGDFLNCPSESERYMSVISALISLINFDDDILVIFDGGFLADGEDMSLFSKYISEINKQIIFVIHNAYIDEIVNGNYVPYGYYINKNSEYSSSPIKLEDMHNIAQNNA